MFETPSPARSLVTAAVAGLALLVAGCAAQEAIQTERLLAASGFQMRLADTPQREAQVESLPQLKLIPQQRDGELTYVYADAKECKCIYAGTEAAYQRYQKLAVQQQIADERLEAAQEEQLNRMDWGMWGPWGPWY
ncbi:MAG: hypothetical protein AAF495_19845 [Pseudomonadota bacterium]